VWQRTVDGIVSGVHVYRLQASYGICCWVRLEPFVRLENRSVELMPPSGCMPEWRIFDDAGVATAVGEAGRTIDHDIRPWLAAMSSRKAVVDAVAGHGVGRRIETRLAFGQLPALAAVLALGPGEWAEGTHLRDFNLLDIDAAARGYQALGVAPSPEWHAFIERAVRSFRGRPAKHLRARHDSVKAAFGSWAPPATK
jgi:hypothetical protein